MKRETTIWLLLTVAAMAGGIVLACAGDTGGKEGPVYCLLPLQAWMDECGFSVKMDGVNEMTLDEAYDSCKHGYGKVWQYFLHCYHEVFLKEGRDCEAFAECAPDHGLPTDDDTADDDSSPVDDDTTPVDDDTTPADDDTTPADDDTTPADDDTSPTD
ncbi:MAG: hypothetical protein GX444_18390 [Myxococcales bacterium]|nr:hypothetical protein [Myxococcales bacterium]